MLISRTGFMPALVVAATLHGLGAYAATGNGERVVVSGTVPDEPARVAILDRLRQIYGADRIDDRLEVGGVVPPPNWAAHVERMLAPNIRQIHKGSIQVDGTRVALRGEVGNEAQRQQIASEVATALNPTYTVNNALEVVASSQDVLDQALADRIIEFETGSARLTPAGTAILDEIAAALGRIGGARVQIVGHTDNSGTRIGNIALSLDRANAVRDYLAGKGIAPGTMTALGAGPDKPRDSNDTPEGRARNRRIEFRVLQ